MPIRMDSATLQAALAGYQQRLGQIDESMADLRRRIGKSGRPESPVASGPSPRRNTMSAEGRARIAAAQKARWAKAKKLAKKAGKSEAAD